MKKILFLLAFIPQLIFAQSIRWTADGNAYYKIEEGAINRYELPTSKKTTILSREELTVKSGPLEVENFQLYNNGNLILIYTHSKRVWRLNTEGDYWVYNREKKHWHQIGAQMPASSLRFAKLSPDGTKAAYVSEFDLYMEDLETGKITAISENHDRKLITGTFDWAYEEEFACRDGFQWSPDSKNISYWQIDAREIPFYYMVNITDSVYSRTIPVEYPTIGNKPSAAKIGVYSVEKANTIWLDIPGDPSQNYLPRMEWNSNERIMVQQLNRKQNESKIYSCNPLSGKSKMIWSEQNEAWVDLFAFEQNSYSLDFRHSFVWLNNGKEFLWASEKDGWNHFYKISVTGEETLLTKGEFDVINYVSLDEKRNQVYFMASPDNATQSYLYKVSLKGKNKIERVTPAEQPGTHSYSVSPNGNFATHTFSNSYTRPIRETIDLTTHKALDKDKSVEALRKKNSIEKNVEFFKITTVDGVEMDGWMTKPKNFDPEKKYPVLFYVYTEPASQTVMDRYGAGMNRMYLGDMAEDGYIYISLDGRGTPAPKGSAWRKAIYRNIGKVNIRDQAMAAKEIIKWPFVDADRIAVWGWSGGGSTTLNLLFQYPEIYKTGVAVAAVANQLTYDNIYQERYMGLPQENLEDIVQGSPVTHAKNLQGNLLYIHGTGDDNVHYNNAEMLINELVKYNKQFQLMVYPNRSHGIWEGEGTSLHLATTFTNFIQQYCPPGPKEELKIEKK